MIMNTRDLMRYCRADLTQYEVKNAFFAFLTNPVIRFTILLRLNELLFNISLSIVWRLLFRFWLHRLSYKLGFYIPFNVFGPGLCIVHYGLLVVSAKARIGRNCRVNMGVQIGQHPITGDAPVIGDDCLIGPGAKIFGAVSIPDGCIIGANAVVNRSFSEPESLIVGCPAIAKKMTKSMNTDPHRLRTGQW